jgi:hypothetical protein
MNQNISNIENWSCTISFKNSTSKDFDTVLELAKLETTFVEKTVGNQTTFEVTYTEQPEDYLKMLELWNMIKGWKSSQARINGELVDRKTFGKINKCYGEKCRSNNPDYCYGYNIYMENPFGCHRSKIHQSNYTPWYTYGEIDQNDFFNIDKASIQKELINQLNDYKKCPALNIDIALKNLKKLPSSLYPDIDRGWEYVYDDDYPNSKKIIGVEPNFNEFKKNSKKFTKADLRSKLKVKKVNPPKEKKPISEKKQKANKKIWKATFYLYIFLGIFITLVGNKFLGIGILAVTIFLKIKSRNKHKNR